MSFETQVNQTFWRDIPGLCAILTYTIGDVRMWVFWGLAEVIASNGLVFAGPKISCQITAKFLALRCSQRERHEILEGKQGQ